MDQNLEAPPGMGGPPAHHGQDSASPVIWLAAPCQGRGWGLRYHVVTHGDKAGAEIIRVHHACLLLWGQGHQDTRRRKGRPRARKTGHRWPEGRSRCTVLGSGGRGGQEGERNTGGRDAKTHPGKISTGRRKTEQRDAKSVHGMESDEERGLLTANGKDFKNKEEILILLDAVWEPEKVAVIYCWAHQKEGALQARGNPQADGATK